jgi:succinyl-CoA synthetase beta subunit
MVDKKALKNKIKELTTEKVVIKVQIKSGGRKKAGGIVIVNNNTDNISLKLSELFQKSITTHQKKNQVVHSIYIEECCEIDREFYISFTLNRSLQSTVLIASKEGGINIEDNKNSAIFIQIDPFLGLREHQTHRVYDLFALPFNNKDLFKKLHYVLRTLYQFYVDFDATLVEINPLVLDTKGNFILLDAKVELDENALHRKAKIKEILAQKNKKNETDKSEKDLNYIELDGDIGCLVNGAGLAMGTMDFLQMYDLKPANFLDIGGNATIEKIKAAFSYMTHKKPLAGIFINIFGGIVRCDAVAQAIIDFLKEKDFKELIVARFQGTNCEKAKEMLRLLKNDKIICIDDLKDAVRCLKRTINSDFCIFV